MENNKLSTKYKIRLGVVCFARNTFDFTAAKDIYSNILSQLSNLDNIELVAVKELIFESPDAIKAGRLFAEKQVDGIVAISGTFHLGHLVLDIKKLCDKPLLLWALPELPYDGGKIRLNSVCGVNLDASNLVKSGINDFVYSIGSEIDENWVDAIRMCAALRDARIGIIGSRAHGFFNVGADELSLYGKFGTLIDHFELSDLWAEKVDEKDTLKYLDALKNVFNI
ncbi:MAG: fucose isomerase, partial [Clostridia bacterium]